MRLVHVETEDGSPPTPEQYAELGSIRRRLEAFFRDEGPSPTPEPDPPTATRGSPQPIMPTTPATRRRWRPSGPALDGMPEDISAPRSMP